jgi:hypothetical protein
MPLPSGKEEEIMFRRRFGCLWLFIGLFVLIRGAIWIG